MRAARLRRVRFREVELDVAVVRFRSALVAVARAGWGGTANRGRR